MDKIELGNLDKWKIITVPIKAIKQYIKDHQKEKEIRFRYNVDTLEIFILSHSGKPANIYS